MIVSLCLLRSPFLYVRIEPLICNSLYSVPLRSPCATNTFLALIIAPLLQTQAATGMGGLHVVRLKAVSIVPRPSLGVRLLVSPQMNRLKATTSEDIKIHDLFFVGIVLYLLLVLRIK